MSRPTPPAPGRIRHPPGFRARRGANWGCIGLLYASFYMCRYDLAFANDSIRNEFGFSREDMGNIITTMLLAYACGLIINGLLTDRMGGKRAMLIGAAGTIAMNLLFGAASFAGMLGLFLAIRGVDGYMQAFGAPGMVKINAAWFGHRERGRFAGILGFMINLGRFGIGWLAPAILGGVGILGLMRIPPLHWRWLFWVPSVICALAAAGVALTVKETPAEAGFAGATGEDLPPAKSGIREDLGQVLRVIASKPVVWVTACAYACTGVVRQSVDQWFPSYMKGLYLVDLKSPKFQWLLVTLIPLVASVGSFVSGYVSDTLFMGRRVPVAAVFYFVESAIILLAAQFHTANAAIVFLVLISFTANSTHSILGAAVPMDIGGPRMAGFALGLIDSFQYFGGSLAGHFLGRVLDKNLGNYFYFMAPFGMIGGLLMLTILGKVTQESRPEPPPGPAGGAAPA